MDFYKMTKEELIEYIKNLSENENGKYGLVWDKEKEPEQIVVDCDKYIPVLREVKDKNINNGGQENILIEGDNFHSLTILNYTHKEKVDVIYIDPPYNTGHKDFMYNDRFVDSEDGYRHSKWLNFMEKRLKLARNLLKSDGMLFISIDDNELFQLKLLCDKIFGEKNYINTISVNAKVSAGASGGGEDKKLKKNIEYILFYCKNIDDVKLNTIYKETNLMDYISKMKEDNKSFKYTSVLYKIEDIEKFTTIQDGSGDNIEISKVNNYEIKSVKQVAQIENLSEEEVYNKYIDKIFTTTNAQTSIRTRVWKATGNKNEMYIASYIPKSGKNKGNKINLIFMGKQKVLVIWLKDTCTITKNKPYKKEKIGTYWDGFSWINVTKEGAVKFDNGKKPIKLIKQVLTLHPNKNALVLDFFAGSGSTGHATLDLNAEDDGKRKFILCANNENNICEDVTYMRIKNVINGYNNKTGLEGSLKYFKTDFVDNTNNRDQLYYDLTEKCISMLCLKEGCFNQISATSEYMIFSNINKTKYTCVYFDIFGNLEQDFVNKLENIDEDKVIYKFSLGDYVDETPFKNVKNYIIEAIPYKIVELYRKLVKLSKEEI